MKKQKQNNNSFLKAVQKSAAIAALAACAYSAWKIYRLFLPPAKIQRQDTVYPFAILLGCPARKDGTISRSGLRRCNLAIAKWKEHAYQTLIISGGKTRYGWVESEVMREYIHKQQPEIPILCEEQSTSTWMNLKNVRKMIGDQNILLLTGSLHVRRSCAIASHFFTQYAAAFYPEFSLKKALREIVSQGIYIRLEIKKLLTLM